MTTRSLAAPADIEGQATAGERLPALYSVDPSTAERVLQFFTVNIRNKNTRKAYARAERAERRS